MHEHTHACMRGPPGKHQLDTFLNLNLPKEHCGSPPAGQERGENARRQGDKVRNGREFLLISLLPLPPENESLALLRGIGGGGRLL